MDYTHKALKKVPSLRPCWCFTFLIFGQRGVTSIGAVLPPATRVKKFDRQFFTLTLDFARKKLLTVDPMHYNFNRSAGPAHVTRHVTSLWWLRHVRIKAICAWPLTHFQAWPLTSTVFWSLTLDWDLDPGRGWKYRAYGGDTPLLGKGLSTALLVVQPWHQLPLSSIRREGGTPNSQKWLHLALRKARVAGWNIG